LTNNLTLAKIVDKYCSKDEQKCAKIEQEIINGLKMITGGKRKIEQALKSR